MPTNPMNITPPVPETTQGPAWAEQINDILTDNIAEHDHTTNKGVQITPAGLNLNTDVDLQENNLTSVRSVRLQDQASAISSQDDVGCLYEVNGDLYYNSGDGDQVPITAGGSLAATSFGGINGLPNGTAQVGYANDTYTFKSSATNYAIMDTGEHKIRSSDDTSPATGITIKSPNSLPVSFDITLPTALPNQTSFMTIGSNGAMTNNIPTAGGITKSNLAAVGQASVIATTPKTITTQFTDIMTLSLTSTGRPIVVSSQGNPNGDGTGNADTYFSAIATGTSQVRQRIKVITNGTTTLYFNNALNSFETYAYVPIFSILLLPQGNHVITLQALRDGGNTTSMSLIKGFMIAYEL